MALGSNNIKFSDVKSVLGESTNTLSGLCTSDKINKWSKWKPILSDVPLTEAIINAKDYGFTFELYTDFYSIVGPANDGTALNDTWDYNKPTSKYRLGDFRNYDHDATGILSMTATKNEDNVTLTFSPRPSILCNMNKFSNDVWYLSVIGIKSGNTATAFVYQFSDLITVSNTKYIFLLPITGISNIVGTGTIKIIPVLSDYTINSGFHTINKDNILQGGANHSTVTALTNSFVEFDLEGNSDLNL